MNCRTLTFGLLYVVSFGQIFSQSPTKKLSFVRSDAIINNPERGFYRLKETGMAQGKITSYVELDPRQLQRIRKEHTLLFRYFGLKEWRTVDLPDSVLRNIRRDFNAIRSAGLKCIPRFTYSANIGEPDASLNIILRHIRQLKPILQENKDVIAVMQAGFIGAWGEWHSSTNGNESVQNMRTILNAILDALPPDRTVQLRTPRSKQQIFGLSFDAAGAITPQIAYSGTPVARVGHHNDCFLADDNDMGTYWRNNRLDTALAKLYLQMDNRFVPMGGETCQPSEFTTCANALREMARMRWSFLNADFNSDVLKSFESSGCMDEMKRILGYRFSLLRTEFTSRVSQSGSFKFVMTLTNTGWAAPFNRREAELLLRNTKDGSIFCVKLPADPRFWLSGDTASVSVLAGIPPAMKSGWYSVLLNFPDPEAALHPRPEYSIQLANKNVWESKTGYNNLHDSVFIELKSKGKAHKGLLWFKPPGKYVVDPPKKFALNTEHVSDNSIMIPFLLGKPSRVLLQVFGDKGKHVASLVDETLPASSFPYSARFVRQGKHSGSYIVRFRATPVDGSDAVNFIATRKLLSAK